MFTRFYSIWVTTGLTMTQRVAGLCQIACNLHIVKGNQNLVHKMLQDVNIHCKNGLVNFLFSTELHRAELRKTFSDAVSICAVTLI